MSAGPIIALLLVVVIAILLYCEARYEAKASRGERGVFDYERIRSSGGWR